MPKDATYTALEVTLVDSTEQSLGFIDTLEITDGFTWQSIECREVDSTLPAITIDTPTGKSLVCNKLTK